MTTLAYLHEIAKVLDLHKAHAITALDVSGLTVVCDYMLIASGRNVNQTRSLADDVDDRMAELGYDLRRSEGRSDGRWIILDYGDILVELFNQEEREFYNIERLWSDGTNRIELAFAPEDN